MEKQNKNKNKKIIKYPKDNKQNNSSLSKKYKDKKLKVKKINLKKEIELLYRINRIW